MFYCSCHVDVTGLETVGPDELVHDIDEDVSGDAPPEDNVVTWECWRWRRRWQDNVAVWCMRIVCCNLPHSRYIYNTGVSR